MNKYRYLLMLLFVNTSMSYAAAPLDDITNIQCPSQEGLSAYNPQRIAQNTLRYWFGGKYLQWTPMSVDVTMAPPYTKTSGNAVPKLQARFIQLDKTSDNHWVVKCTFQVIGGYDALSEGTTSLTVEAKNCMLNKTQAMVYCQR